MAEEEVVENTQVAPKSNGITKWLIGVAVILLAFLIGLVPMWLTKLELASQFVTVEKELRRSRMQNTLASATIYARRGEYETARQNTSIFFTEVRSEMDKGNDGILSEQERIGLNRVMAERDEIITLLSRNDPASAERLSNAFIEYVGVVPGK